MRQIIAIVPQGQGKRALRIAQDHDGINLALLKAEGPDSKREIVHIHAPNHKVEPLLDQLQQIDHLHITITPHGVIALRPPPSQAPETVMEVSHRSPLEIYLSGLQSIGSWRGFLSYALLDVNRFENNCNMKPVILWLGVGLLMSVHVYSGKIKWLQVIPRSRWLSMASGVSVAYVFLHLMPELAKAQTHVEQHFQFAVKYLDHHIYIIALLGLAVFYGLERMALRSRQQRQETAGSDRTSDAVFWIHMIAFACYNILIGYLAFHLEDQTLQGIVFFFIAMALHFLVNDYGLTEHHKEAYRSKGKWILSLAIGLGAVLGQSTTMSEGILFTAVSFLAGGVILNVLKEELPEKRQSRFWAFSVGTVVYSFLLMLFK